MKHALTLLVVLATARAYAWEPFLVENEAVQEGNERMGSRPPNPQAALRSYDEAARALPHEPAVQLNRGLAMLEAGELGRAREAFVQATEPPASAEVRADAFYDLGLAFYREADAAAGEQNHEEAQRLFREAADAFRNSLRVRPGDEDAGWNLELALRRMREQEQQQEQQEEQERQQQEQEQQEQEQQEQEQQQEGEQREGDQEEQQEGDQQEQEEGDQQEGDPQQQEGEQQEGDQEEQGDEPGEGTDSSDDADDSDEPGQQPEQGGDQGGEGTEAEGERPPTGGTLDGLPPEHRRVLDALENSEDNLERHRARVRAARERRRVEQDW